MQDDENIYVSVIMPVYNRENSIMASINSVLNQEFKGFELIIVDDASDDSTVDIINSIKDKRIKVIELEKNMGANAARNRGIISSKGKYLAFIDSDDCWTKDKLEVQINYMVNHNLKASFSPYIITSCNTIVPADYMEYCENYNSVKEMLKIYNIIGTPTLVIDREVINNIGLFDENMPRLQDYELSIRIVQKYDIGCCPKILLRVDGITDSKRISNNKDALYKALGILISKHYCFMDFSRPNIVMDALFDDEDKLIPHSLEKILNHCDNHKVDLLNEVIIKQNRKILQDNMIWKNVVQRNIDNIVSQRFVIWGAGGEGKKIYNKLKEMGKIPRYFIVSGKTEIESIDQIQVKTVSDINTEEFDVILGVAKRTQLELIKEMRKYKFKTVIAL